MLIHKVKISFAWLMVFLIHKIGWYRQTLSFVWWMRFLLPQGLMWTKNCESLCTNLHLWFLPFFWRYHYIHKGLFNVCFLKWSAPLSFSPAETSNVENFNCQFNYRGLLLKHKSLLYQTLRTSIVNSITYRGFLLKHKSFFDWICWMPRNSIVNSITGAPPQTQINHHSIKC